MGLVVGGERRGGRQRRKAASKKHKQHTGQRCLYGKSFNYLAARAVLGDPLPQGHVVRLQVDLLILLFSLWWFVWLKGEVGIDGTHCQPHAPPPPNSTQHTSLPPSHHLHPLLVQVLLLLPALVEQPPAAVARLLVLVPVPVQDVVQPPALLRAAWGLVWWV